MKNIVLILAVVVLGIAACDTPQSTTTNGTDSTSINSNGNMNNNSTIDTASTGSGTMPERRDSMP